jgi:hypothetical protein
MTVDRSVERNAAPAGAPPKGAAATALRADDRSAGRDIRTSTGVLTTTPNSHAAAGPPTQAPVLPKPALELERGVERGFICMTCTHRARNGRRVALLGRLDGTVRNTGRRCACSPADAGAAAHPRPLRGRLAARSEGAPGRPQTR